MYIIYIYYYYIYIDTIQIYDIILKYYLIDINMQIYIYIYNDRKMGHLLENPQDIAVCQWATQFMADDIAPTLLNIRQSTWVYETSR